jgi:hypothetical protein
LLTPLPTPPAAGAGKEGKQFGVPAEPTALVAHVSALLDDIQANLLAEATAFRWAWQAALGARTAAAPPPQARAPRSLGRVRPRWAAGARAPRCRPCAPTSLPS